MSYIDDIKNYICRELAPDIEAELIPNDCNLLSAGVIDSLSLMRLIIWIEECFDIALGDMEIAPEDFSSVTRIDSFISKHRVPVI